MLSPQVKQVVERSMPTEDVAFLVSVRLRDELLRIAGIPDVTVRASMLDALYQKAKEPLVEAISKYEDDGMRIINDLDGSAQLIVSGPAGLWLKVMHEPSLSAPNVVFSPNAPSWST